MRVPNRISRSGRAFYLISITTLLFLGSLVGQSVPEDVTDLSLEQAREILNRSPWARQETVTRVIEGVGSGVFGEKEIFSRYFIRIVSAPPIRKAYARIEGALKESTQPGEKQGNTLEALRRAGIHQDINRYIVIALSFRSNDPRFEQEVRAILESQTLQTVKTLAYLSTTRFPQVELVAFYPPVENAIGAMFVFPKKIDGVPTISEEDSSFVLELDLPGDAPSLRTTFPVSEEVLLRSESLSVSRGAANLDTAEFQPQIHEMSQTVDLQSERVAELVNLFPVQKKGTFHGSIYEFHRNDNLDARNFFDPVGERLPEFKRNQFGANLGVALGPRLNFFGSYDGLRIIQGSTILSHIPSPKMKSGDFSELLSGDFQLQLRDPDTGQPFPGNRVPEERIHPTARGLLPLLPDPNRSDPSRNFVNSHPRVDNQDEVAFRVDFQLDENNTVAGRYSIEDREGVRPHPLPGFDSRRQATEHEVSISYTRTFNSSLVGRWELDFDRDTDLWMSSDTRQAGLLESLGIQGVEVPDARAEGFPVFELVGYRSFGDEGLPETEVENRVGFDTNLTYVRGDHIIQFESEIRFRQINNNSSPSLQRGLFAFTGELTGDAFADFLLGQTDVATRALGSSRQDLRNKDLEFFLSDEWKIHPQFTFTAGGTYQYSPPYGSIHNNVSTFHPLLFEPPQSGELVVLGSQQAKEVGLGGLEEGEAVFPDRNDFAPRIG